MFDDRSLNKEPFVADPPAGARVSLRRSTSSKSFTQEAFSRTWSAECTATGSASPVAVSFRWIRRRSNSAARRNGQHLSPEFRSIRDSIDLPRMAEIPLFPAEIPWFMTINSATRIALVEIWGEEKDAGKAAAIADAIYSIYPKPEDWVASWRAQPPPEWIMAVNRVMRAGLTLPFELGGDLETLDRYNEWLERTVLEPMRKSAPDSYRAIVEHLRNFVLNSRNDDHARN